MKAALFEKIGDVPTVKDVPDPNPEAGDVETSLERAQGLAVLAKELVQQSPAGRIGQCPEHLVHACVHTSNDR